MNTSMQKTIRKRSDIKHLENLVRANLLRLRKRRYSRYLASHLTRSTIEYMERSIVETKSRLPFLEDTDIVMTEPKRKSNTSIETQSVSAISKAMALFTKLRVKAHKGSITLAKTAYRNRPTLCNSRSTYLQRVIKSDGSCMYVRTTTPRSNFRYTLNTGDKQWTIESALCIIGLIVVSYLIIFR